MKLLMINYEYPPLGGGAGNSTANLAAELSSLGAEVDVLTSAFHGLSKYEKVNDFSIYRTPVIRRYLHQCSTPEMMTFIASASLSSIKLAGRQRPDATVAFFGIPSGPVAYLLKMLFNIPYFVLLRGGDVPGFQPYDLKMYHRLAGPVLREIWSKAARVIGNSTGLSDMARRFYPNIDIETISNGVDTVLYSPGGRHPEPGRCRALFVGRLTYQKGLDVIIEALKGLDVHVRPQLTVAGDGNARFELERRVAESGLEDDVRFIGWYDRANIPDLYRDADMFVLPSRHEGMSNALLEAMASGLPVIATRIAGNEELVSHDETGLLVPVEDASALSEAMARLTKDSSLRRRIGNAGRELILARYSWKMIAKEYLELIERSLSLKN
jgi:glycosyltransferase involved in cell wall biosynthesis